VGDRYGHWTVLSKEARYKVLCQCDCKNKTIREVDIYRLLGGKSTSCGCAKQKHYAKVGEKYNHLTILELKAKKSKDGRWLCKCQCDCENKTIYYARIDELISNKIKSCGCSQFDGLHNEVKTRFHTTWSGIKSRCLNVNEVGYKNYGGRGIKVCDKWLDYLGFREDMLESYQQHVKEYGEKDTFIDRIDVDKDYCKENCRWATRKEQNNNKRYHHYLTDAEGVTHNVAEWSEITGIKYGTIMSRIKLGWSDVDILNKKARNQRR